ncbi:unnamed protein product [Sphenostylis stenocarpa]|uniref:Disease resistance protein Roq1-like winged-helix domain-containing protein n=1 Tax=Sphenostylis stenocarpa TaxID=92480 RepID=A0AA86SAG7_9FABA|nr:unnamed protein product [Sphenostylis stenocarpa]
MECHASRGQVVLPVFYFISHWSLRDLRDVSFEVIFQQAGDISRERQWQFALSNAARLAGWDVLNYMYAYAFWKDRDYVTEILNDCELHADIGITVLLERSLIKVEKYNKLGIHDLLRDIGRKIVHQISPLEPQKRSRLWVHDDIVDKLTEQTATGVIEGLALKMQRTSRVCFSTEAFEKMKKLRLLQLDHVYKLAGDYGNLPKQLRWLLERLKFLNLSSKHLSKTPDFSKLPNLEKLILKDCPSLIGYVSLRGYEGLARDVFPTLIWSWMSHTGGFSSCIQPFGIIPTSIVSMDILDNFQITQELRMIRDELCNVNFSESKNAYLSQISEMSIVSHLTGMGSCHQVFDMLSNSISEALRTNGCTDFVLPGDNYPYWLAYTGNGYSIYKQATTMTFTDEDWQGVISNLGPGDNVEVFVGIDHGITVKKTAVYLIYGQSITMRIEPRELSVTVT